MVKARAESVREPPMAIRDRPLRIEYAQLAAPPLLPAGDVAARRLRLAPATRLDFAGGPQ